MRRRICYYKTNITKISDSLGVQEQTHPPFSLEKIEDDKETAEKEINLLLSCVRWNWILTKIMLLKGNSTFILRLLCCRLS